MVGSKRVDSRREPFVALIVLDGWGSCDTSHQCNAVALADTPHWDRLLREYPNSRLEASGEAVGLMPNQMGNSNVGHLNLGAGRVVYQDLLRINRDIAGGAFFNNETLRHLMLQVREKGAALHLMGLLSDGGVHSHIDHLFALLKMASSLGVGSVFIHCFLDGRDVPPSSALTYIESLQERLSFHPGAVIATVMGRYYAMDRDRRWERTSRAYRAMVEGEGLSFATPEEAITSAYRRGETDEFIQPSVIGAGPDQAGDQAGHRASCIRDGDGVIFYNFRADRARQLTRALIATSFDDFDRGGRTLAIDCVGMTQYDAGFDLPVAFPPESPQACLGQVLSEAGLNQLRIAETEKYAHVTFFFNGGIEEPYPGEERVLIPSPPVATYDLQPEMSAAGVTSRLLRELDRGRYDFILANYANADMVGHTGKLAAAIAAVEAVDMNLGMVTEGVVKSGGVAIIVSDHGNVEQMEDEGSGQPHTAHTTNPVPCVLVGREYAGRHGVLADGILANIAPTVLDLFEIEKPVQMTGSSLIR